MLHERPDQALWQARRPRPAELELFAGSFVALLGPNGAGKSTLFQVLTGLFAADEGDVEVAGHSLRHAGPAALRHIGVVFQQMSLDLDLSIRRNLQFQADLQGPARRAGARAHPLGLCALRLEASSTWCASSPAATGRKVELVRANLHQPAVLLMDEATVGLDPKSRQDLLAALHADVRERGVCVLWATHWVEEADGADRVLVLHKGRLLADGSAAAVTVALGGATLEPASSPHAELKPNEGDKNVTHCRRRAWHCCWRWRRGWPPPRAPPVSSEKDDALTLIDTQTLAVKGTSPTCKRGRHIQRLPDGKLMVACTDSNAADVIDPATGSRCGACRWARTRGLRPLARRQDHLRLQRGRGRGQLRRRRQRQGAQVDQGRPGARGREGQRRRQDAVRHLGSGQHGPRDRRGQRQGAKNVKVGKRPRRMAITPDGKELWVTNELGSSVSIVSTADHSVIGEIKFAVKGARAEDITPVGITMTRTANMPSWRWAAPTTWPSSTWPAAR